jgi:hypothetical protein
MFDFSRCDPDARNCIPIAADALDIQQTLELVKDMVW